MPYIGNQHNVGDHVNNFKVLDDISSYTATFDGSASSVVTVADETIRIPEHRFIQGQRVVYNNGGGSNIGGLSSGSAYYVSFDSANTIKLATSLENANSNTVINLSITGGGTSHTLTASFDGVNTKFKLTHGNGKAARLNNATQLNVAINNVIQRPNVSALTFTEGFALEDNHKIVFKTAPTVDDIFWGSIIANTIENFDLKENEVNNFTGNGSTTEFTLSSIPANNESVVVTIDGVLQHPSDSTTARAYTLIDSVLQFTAAPALNAEIQVRHIGFAGASTNDVSGFYGRTGNVALTANDNITTGDITARNFNATGITTFGTANFSGSVSIGGTLTYEDVINVDSVGVGTFREGIFLPDGKIAKFGNTAADPDLEIYHGGTNSIIKNSTGRLYLGANDITVSNRLLNETKATFNNNASVDLYYNGSKKFETSEKGIKVGTGVTIETNGQATFTGITTFSDDIKLPDDTFVRLGDLSTGDFTINHDGARTMARQHGIGSFTLDLLTSSNPFNITKANLSETIAKFIPDGAVELYYDGLKKFETRSNGVNVTGRIFCDGTAANNRGLIFNDNVKISLGSSNDLEIFHDGNHSRIKDAGTGDLVLISNTISLVNAADSETLAQFKENGSVDLYYDNTKRFETTSQGINVIGHSELDNANVSGVVTFTNSPNAIQMNDGARVSFGTSLKTSISYDTGTSRTKIRNFNDTLEIGYRTTELHYINQARLTIAGSNAFSSDAATTFAGTSYNAGWYPSSNGGTFKFNDNARLALGSNGDTNFFHNNSHFYLQNTTGNINFDGNVVVNDDISVDGHTNLDNVSVAGVSTFSDVVGITSSLNVTGITSINGGYAPQPFTVIGGSHPTPNHNHRQQFVFRTSHGHTDLKFENSYGGNWAGSSVSHTRILWESYGERNASVPGGDYGRQGEFCSIQPIMGVPGQFTNLIFKGNDGVVGLSTMMRMYPYRQQLCVNGETTAQVDQVGLGITGNIYHLNDWNSNYSAFDTYFGFPGNNTFHLFTSDTRKLYITSNQLILENLSQGVTINSNVDLNGDIDVDGHTNLDNVSIAGVSTITGMSNHSSRIQMLAGNAVRFLNAGNSASTEIKCDGGARLNITSYNQTMATFENGQSTIFYTNNGQNRLQIANDGNVTIAKELQAGSKIVAYDSTSTSNQVRARIKATASNDDGRVGVYYGNTEIAALFGRWSGSQFTSGLNIPYEPFIVTGASGAERLRITSNGNIGINAAAPQANAKLQVGGNVGSSGYFYTTTTSTPQTDFTSSQTTNKAGLLLHRQSETNGDYGGLEFHGHPSSITSYRKGGIYYKTTGSGFGRGDIIFANDTAADANNVSPSDHKFVIKNDGSLRAYTNSNAVSCFSNSDHGNVDFNHRGGRVLTSNGTGWDGNASGDGSDPILVLAVENRAGNSDISDAYGLCLHSESQDDNDYGPLIGWSNRSNSGSYNTTYAAIVGQKTGQSTDSNWSAGALHFFTAKATSGSGGYMTNEADMKIDATGRVLTPRQVSFYATANSGGTVSMSSPHTLTNWRLSTSGKTFDIGGNFSTTNGRFTAPVSGKYLFTGSILLAGYDQASGIHVSWRKNGTVYQYWYNTRTSDIDRSGYGGYLAQGSTTTFSLSANDYVDVHISFNGSLSLWCGDSNWGHFSGHLLG